MKIELPKPEEMSTERYFEIRDIDREGCGAFQTFCVKEGTNEEIGQIASEIWTERMLEAEARYFPRMFSSPPKWRSTIKVVEMKRETEKLPEVNKWGKDYKNIWTTKRGGLKFTIENNWIRMKMSDGSIRTGNGYSFGRIFSPPKTYQLIKGKDGK